MTEPTADVATKPAWVARVLSEKRRAWLAQRRHHLWLVVLSVLLCAPSVTTGLVLDDYAHQVMVTQPAGADAWWHRTPHILDLFRFVDGSEVGFLHSVEMGTAPWYMSPSLKLAFMRPLASLTHAFDYTFLASAPWLMHVHSLLWLFALGWAASHLIRQLEKGWMAGMLILLFVLDAGHGVPAGWLANRNTLIAGTFAALGVAAHIRWRRGELKTPLRSLGFMAVAVLAGESMIGWCALPLAFALTLDPAGWRRGLLALTPLTGLVVVWRIIYGALGYGAGGSALYVDPVSTPLRFLGNVAKHWPQLVAGQMGGPPTGVLTLVGPAAAAFAIGVSVLVVIGFAFATRSLWRDPKVRCWLLFGAFAAIPVCATNPHARLMVASGLGFSGVLAHFIARAVEGETPRWWRRLAAFWLVLVVVVSGLGLAFNVQASPMIGEPNQLAANSVPDRAAGKTLVVLSVPDPMFMCNQLPAVLLSRNLPLPRRLRCLVPTETQVDITQEDDHTLVLESPNGLLATFFVPLVRKPGDAFPEDWRLRLSDSTITIAKRDDRGDPLAMRVRFDVPLSDPSLVFVAWSPNDRGFTLTTLPDVGETMTIESQPMMDIIQ